MKPAIIVAILFTLAGCKTLFTETEVVTMTPLGRETNIVYVVSDKVNGSLATAKVLNSFNPTPSNPLITLGISSVAGIMSLVAGILTRKNNRKGKMLEAIVGGIEKGSTSGEVKKAIQSEARYAGVSQDIHKFVKELIK